MKKIFLGRPIHWLIAIGLCIIGWLAGGIRLHVTDFNLFIIALIAIVVALAASVLLSRILRWRFILLPQIFIVCVYI